jgi:hypothetical protein
MECTGIDLFYANISVLRCYTGLDGYSASWTRYDIASHQTSANILMNCLTPWTKHTSGY